MRSASEERNLRAAALFQKAIDLDPTSVRAHFGLFSTYVRRGAVFDNQSLREPLAAVATHLAQIAPNSCERWQASAVVKWVNWHFQDALADALRATESRATSKAARAHAFGFYGFMLGECGREKEAVVAYRRAEKEDPVEPTTQHQLGYNCFWQRNFDCALEYAQKSIDLEPGHYIGHWLKGDVYQETGRFMEAIQEYEISDSISEPNNPKIKLFYDDLRQAVRQGDGRSYWERRLELALAETPPDCYKVASYYARLNKKAQAYEWLRNAYQKKSFSYGLMRDFCWDHNDPEFQAIARGIGLLQ